MKQTISQLREQIDEQDQWQRLNNTEIKGVPMKNNENLFEILAKIGQKIMFPITKNNINFVVGIQPGYPTENRMKPIIVSFINRYFKEDFIAAGKAAKSLSSSDIGFSGSNRIYINDHLTIKN